MAVTLRQMQRVISAARRSDSYRWLPEQIESSMFVESVFRHALKDLRILYDGSLAGNNTHDQRIYVQEFSSTIDRMVRKFGPNRTLESFLPKKQNPPTPMPSMACGPGGQPGKQTQPGKGSPLSPSGSPSAQQPKTGPSSAPQPAQKKEEKWEPTPPTPAPPKPMTAQEKQTKHLEELRQKDRKSTRLNSSHVSESRMPSSA